MRAVASALLSATSNPRSVCADRAALLGSVTIPNCSASTFEGSESTVNSSEPFVTLCADPSGVCGEIAMRFAPRSRRAGRSSSW